MKKADLIDLICTQTGQRRTDVTQIVDCAIETMVGALKKHSRVHITGLGIFEPRRRKARLGTDPRTQEPIRIPATWSLVFRPGKQLRTAITGKDPRERKSK